MTDYVRIGKRTYDTTCPPRCGLHQIIRSQGVSLTDPSRCCLWCKHYTKDWDCKRCYECLGTDDMDAFEPDPIDIEQWQQVFANREGVSDDVG